jgi:hypothetical protein
VVLESTIVAIGTIYMVIGAILVVIEMAIVVEGERLR